MGLYLKVIWAKYLKIFQTYSLKKKAEERKRRQENGIYDEKDSELNLIIPAMAKLETRPYKPGNLTSLFLLWPNWKPDLTNQVT